MQRYFVQSQQIRNKTIHITNDDVHHIKKVMRFRVGAKLICVDGVGNDYLVEIIEMGKQEIICQILQATPSTGEPQCEIVLAQAIPKGERFDFVLQKATELGVTRIIPFHSSRTVVKIHSDKAVKKRERWQRIVKEAAEQSGRGIIPQVDLPVSWKELLVQVSEFQAAWIAYEQGGQSLRTCLESETDLKQILLIIGPEGGFTPEEITEVSLAGGIPITLGPRILRTETASLVALSSILYATDELGR